MNFLNPAERERIKSQISQPLFIEKAGVLMILLTSPVSTYSEIVITNLTFWVLFSHAIIFIFGLIILIGESIKDSIIQKHFLTWLNAFLVVVLTHSFIFNYITHCQSIHFALYNMILIISVLLYQQKVRLLIRFTIGCFIGLFATEIFILHYSVEMLTYFATGISFCSVGFIIGYLRIRDTENIKHVNDMYHLTTENSRDLISIHDLVERKIVFISPSVYEIGGYRQDEVIGQSNLYFYHPDELEYLKMAFHPKVLAQNSNGYILQYRLRKKDGTYVWVETTCRALLNEQKKAVRLISITRNIEERKKAELELKQYAYQLEDTNLRLAHINTELENFAYIASHDLKEPLRSIASYVQLLDRRYKSQLDDEAREYIGFAVDGVKRMRDLIDSLLLYSRAGTNSLNPQLISPKDILNNVKQNLRSKIDDNKAQIIIAGELPKELMADKLQITQLFQNLIDNAIKYRNPELTPVIAIKSVQDKNTYVFSISDNGVGIAEEHFESIFKIFNRLNIPGSYEGSGIGLAVCKRIVIAHGGQIWVESVPEKGSTFHFSLPIVQG